MGSSAQGNGPAKTHYEAEKPVFWIHLGDDRRDPDGGRGDVSYKYR